MNFYISLAKTTVENYIKEGKIITPPGNLPKDFLKKKSGTFITIKKQEQLRGCIGTYLPTKENIAEEIISNTIAAATEDYRFGPIKKEELPYLSYTVYILNEPKLVMELNPVKWASPRIRRVLFDRINPKKYGIIVKTAPIAYLQKTDVMFNGYTPPKSGLLLPDLERVDTAEQQIAIACQKGGINPIKEDIIIYRFTVEKYK